MSRSSIVALGLCVLTLAACQKTPEATSQNHLLVFMENEEGVDPYQTRVIVTPEYVRFDDGEGAQDFVLFDRKLRVIQSVNSKNRTIMRIHEKQLELKPPFELQHAVKDLGEMPDAPTINDRKPRHYQYLTNDQVCVDVVSLSGLMPEATRAISEYQDVLASDSATTFNNMPADLQDPCVITASTFAPNLHLQNGFPIHEWKPGFSRMLTNYKVQYEPDPALFKLPADYFEFSVQDLRDGKVNLPNREEAEDATPQAEVAPVVGEEVKQ